MHEELIVGISAMAVPVFDGFGRLALAIAAMGPTAQLDLLPQGRQATLLHEAAQRISWRLGSAAGVGVTPSAAPA